MGEFEYIALLFSYKLCDPDKGDGSLSENSPQP